MIEVVRPGPLALLEDAGRPGWSAVGVSPSGAFDRAAFVDGAQLVGNDPARHAAVEVILGGLVVRATAAHTVALTGAECPASVDGEPVSWAVALDLGPGRVLSLGLPPRGLRSYLSVGGGFDAPPVLGSRSTDLLSGLGPARLAAGVLLPVGDDRRWRPSPRPSGTRRPGRAEPEAGVLELLPGPRTDWLTDPQDLAGRWTVSPDSNRVGVRLAGPAVPRAREFEGAELPSEPVVRGAVQLPPSGRPVLFGPDHPTTGGYPVVAVLTGTSSDRLGQCRPGDVIRLSWAR